MKRREKEKKKIRIHSFIFHSQIKPWLKYCICYVLIEWCVRLVPNIYDLKRITLCRLLSLSLFVLFCSSENRDRDSVTAENAFCCIRCRSCIYYCYFYGCCSSSSDWCMYVNYFYVQCMHVLMFIVDLYVYQRYEYICIIILRLWKRATSECVTIND